MSNISSIIEELRMEEKNGNLYSPNFTKDLETSNESETYNDNLLYLSKKNYESFNEAIKNILEITANQLEIDRCSIWLLNENSD